MSEPLLPAEIISPPESREERSIRAFRFWRTGLSLREVSKQMGVSHVSVFNWIQEVVAELHEERKKLGIKYVERELATLETLMRPFVILAEQGDYDACDRVLKILDRRARYLGLDAPTKQDINQVISVTRMPTVTLEDGNELKLDVGEDPPEDKRSGMMLLDEGEGRP